MLFMDLKCTFASLKHKMQLFFKKGNLFRIFKKTVYILTCLLFILTSGYSYLEFSFSNKMVGATYILLLCLCLIIFFISLPLIKKETFKANIRKLLNIKNILVCIVLLLLFVSILITIARNNNINGSLRFLIILVSSFLIIFSISFESFAKCFCYTVFVICIISIPIFLIGTILGATGATNFFITNNNAVIYAYGPLSFFVNKWNSYLSGTWETNRLAGPFWEPSIFAAIIVISLLLLYFAPIKKKTFIAVTFVISLILTFSTGGYIVAILSGLLFITRKIKKRDNQNWFVIISLVAFFGIAFLVFGPLLPYLTKLFPTLFGKFNKGLDNVRFYSIQILLNVFIKSPIFGFGINGARIQYISYFPESATDLSITSTSGMMCAAFGVPGLMLCIFLFIAPFLNKKYSFGVNLLINFSLALLINLENMLLMSCVILTLLFFAKEGLYGETSISVKYKNSPKLIDIFTRDSDESKAGKGMLGLLLVKGLSMILGLFTIPVYNSFFGTNELYGAWSVIISVLTWTLLLDFGFGSGLRARLTDIPKEDHLNRKRIISSAYIGSSAIALLSFITFESLVLTLDLNKLMGIGADIISSADLKISVSILLFGLCCELMLKNISFIHYAERKTVLGSSYTLITNFSVIVLFFVFKNSYFLNKMIVGSLFYSLSVIFPLLIGTLIYFLSKHGRKEYPNFKSFNFATCKSVMSFGLLFFLIQIGFLLIARTDSIFISNLYGPGDAGDYSKYYKIFSFFIGLMGSVVQQPVWSAVASAVNQKNSRNIKKMTRITLAISVGLFGFCLLSGILLQTIFDLWLGSNSISVTFWATTSFVVFSFVLLISDAFIIIANGMKIIKSQAIIVLITGTIKIGVFVAMHFSNLLYNFGWPFLIMMDAICYIPLMICLPILIHKKIKLMTREQEGGHIYEKQ